MSNIALVTAARAISVARGRHSPVTPAELARRIIPGYVVTPAIALISDVLREAISQSDGRYIISTPPRTGKSVLASQIGVIEALRHDPDSRVVLTSYADTLAQEHSHAARALIAEHSDLLGLSLRGDKTAVGRWMLDGNNGGLLAAGILSGITGFGADLLLIDDPIKNAQEADSAAHRKRVLHEFRSTLMTRLHPGGSVVVIGTRWHEADLIGTLLDEEGERWTHINIPAIAEAGIPDDLDRAPGVAMTSALGRTAEQLDDMRRSVGERTWYSLFQGVPSPPDGGLIKREWFEQWRLPDAPESPTMTVVGVDPSDSGRGDSCGLVAASFGNDGVTSLIADRSRPMTSDEWATAAVALAMEVGASEIAIEGFTTAETYLQVTRTALDRYMREHPDAQHRPRITPWRARGDSVARSSALLQGLETGTVRLAGSFPSLEDAAVLWQQGQHQPDQLAALVVAHDVLIHSAGVRVTLAAPMGRLGDRGAGGWPVPGAGAPRVASMDAFLRRRIDGRRIG
ncbi:terminase large subunit domain-containing protein [Williamsia maris]|uniref:Terminase n=1 Tax=Williamsia maris TaxID=72806 RepID=A0ABT1HL65_9NOCA|nr:terminase family protein [Williamsia maris]MCP2178685.1 hypothetical protein [Williamsia maris]